MTINRLQAEDFGRIDPGAKFRGDAALVARYCAEIAQAKATFEAHCHYADLACEEPEFAELLRKQHDLFIAACVRGSAGEIEKHGAATVRGYRKAFDMIDDGEGGYYHIGAGERAGNRFPPIVITCGRMPSREEMDAVGRGTVVFTIGEMFELAAKSPGFAEAIAVKQKFPGAQVMPAKPEEEPDGGRKD